MPAPLLPFAKLHSAGRLQPHRAEDSWPKITTTGAEGHTAYCLNGWITNNAEKSGQMASPDSLTSKPPLLAEVSEPTGGKHTCDAV